MVNGPISIADSAEMEAARQNWYNVVNSALDRLGDRVETVSVDLVSAKDILKDDINNCKLRLSEDLDTFEKCELTLSMSITGIRDRLELLENSPIKDELKEAIKEVEKEVDLAKDMLGLRRENCVVEFTKVKERLATVETKVWMFASAVGISSSILTTLTIYLIKTYIF